MNAKLKVSYKNSFKIVIISLLLITSLSILTVKAYADTKQKISYEQLVGVRIKPIIPKNQVDPSIPYFYLREKENSKDTVQLKLINESQKAKKFTVTLNNASTNTNGLIVYETDKYNKEHLKTPLTNIAKIDETDVTVPANGVKLINIKINTPSKKFNGISIGGIVIKEKEDKTKTGGIQNIYSYTVGIVLTEEKKPHLYGHTDLKLTSVKPVLNNGYKLIEADILNPYPEIFNQMKIEGSIFNEKGDKILSNKIEKAAIAPETIIPFSFDLGKEEMKPGKYIFEGIAYAGGKEWKFKNNFIISPDIANKINDNSINKYVLPKFIYWIIIILTLETIGCVVFNYSRINKRRKNK